MVAQHTLLRHLPALSRLIATPDQHTVLRHLPAKRLASNLVAKQANRQLDMLTNRQMDGEAESRPRRQRGQAMCGLKNRESLAGSSGTRCMAMAILLTPRLTVKESARRRSNSSSSSSSSIIIQGISSRTYPWQRKTDDACRGRRGTSHTGHRPGGPRVPLSTGERPRHPLCCVTLCSLTCISSSRHYPCPCSKFNAATSPWRRPRYHPWPAAPALPATGGSPCWSAG